jgi:hypothetical protein
VKKSLIVSIVISIFSLFVSCSQNSDNESPIPKKLIKEEKLATINGANLEMPVKPLTSTSFDSLKAMNVKWVGIIPYGYIRKNSSEVVYDYPFQWWGEKTEGVIKSIQLARKKGLKIMLKPHVWVSGKGWPGEFECKNEKDWKKWEESYHDYIMEFAKIADSLDVEVFCIGTEYRLAVRQRKAFWERLTDSVRSVYKNKVTYAANWDNYENVSFWNTLDFIGIDAYFPVTQGRDPKSNELINGFERLALKLKLFSDTIGKDILFTEYGFRSLDYATSGYYKYQTEELSTNTSLQAEAYKSFLSTFWDKSWIAGGFFWKYQFRGKAELGGLSNDKYTPQYKPAQKVISKYYQ